MAKVGIFQHHPLCSRQCATAVASVLARDHDISLIGLSDITPAGLEGFDLLVMPGGEGDAQRFHSLFALRRDFISSFVQKGGAYLGICMGAYWGGRNYFGLLPQTECVQYITRPRAEIRRSFKTTLRVEWEGASDSMFFYDGCTFLSEGDSFDVIARYSNGDPMAIISNRVGLIGCHPESAQDWYDTPSLMPQWHQGRHHDLLREFVARLIDRPHESKSTVIDRLNAADVPQDHLLQEAAEEIRALRSTLEAIRAATDPFAHGTLRQVNHLAREGLSGQPNSKILDRSAVTVNVKARSD
ncbi:MAG: BPL-N domain-containing protein [Alphaproteobacteria bacterium]